MDRTFDAAPRGLVVLRSALWALLVTGFLTGGSAQIAGIDDTVVQVFGLCVLGYALWVLAGQPAVPVRNVGLALAGGMVLLPLLQLLPLPAETWHAAESRRQLAADLAAVGISPALHWSLAPAATLQAVWFLLPPVGAFFATLALPASAHRGLLRLVLLLALMSLVLAFAQLGVPAESPLNPFPRWARQFNGVFANQNHQAISLVVAIVIALAAMLDALTRIGEGRAQAWAPWVLGFCALLALVALPLTGSRGAVLIGVFGVAAVPLAMGQFTPRGLRHSRVAWVGLLACLGLVVVGVWGTVGWMQADAVDELRGPLREATLALGRSHAPLGTGVGAFVAAFEQGGPDALLLRNYVNHAHNDFLQWWMETSWLGVCLLAMVVGLLATAAARALGRRAADRYPAVAAVVGLAALLVHSWVDYPLRTGSLAMVAAVLAGILVARAGRAISHGRLPAVGETEGQRHTA